MSDPLQETRRLSKAAYPGPWVYRVSGDAVYLDAPKPNGSVRCIAASIHSEQDEANYALMAAARELLPTLAQRVEDAEGARDGFAEAIIGIETRAQNAERENKRYRVLERVINRDTRALWEEALWQEGE